MDFGLVGAVAALAVTLGLLLLTLRVLGRIQGGSARTRGGVPLELLQRMPTGPRAGVALLRVGGRVLVVSMGEGGARLLTELAGDDLTQALRATAAPDGRGAPAGPLAFLRKVAMVLPLLLLPVGLQAQAAGSPTTVPAPAPAQAAGKAPAPSSLRVEAPQGPSMEFRVGQGGDQLRLSGTVGLVVFLGAMTLLPALFLLMTSFTRILIVLHFLRSALGTQGTPPGQLLVAVAVLLTGVVMNPVLQEANRTALQPYFAGEIAQGEAYTRALQPFRAFMLANTRESDLATFTELSGSADVATVEEVPTVTIVSAFVTSELRTAFQMGFVIFLPFVVVDLLVASSLMSLGMFMLPPVMISLPFKLLLFVLADGWSLVAQNLVASFRQ